MFVQLAEKRTDAGSFTQTLSGFCLCYNGISVGLMKAADRWHLYNRKSRRWAFV